MHKSGSNIAHEGTPDESRTVAGLRGVADSPALSPGDAVVTIEQEFGSDSEVRAGSCSASPKIESQELRAEMLVAHRRPQIFVSEQLRDGPPSQEVLLIDVAADRMQIL